jgi:hypothetical protein
VRQFVGIFVTGAKAQRQKSMNEVIVCLPVYREEKRKAVTGPDGIIMRMIVDCFKA